MIVFAALIVVALAAFVAGVATHAVVTTKLHEVLTDITKALGNG